MQELARGRADSAQQHRIVDFILRNTIRGTPYVSGPEGERDTLVLIGQHRLGQILANMLDPHAMGKAVEDDRKRAEALNPPPAVRRPPRRQKP